MVDDPIDTSRIVLDIFNSILAIYLTSKKM